MDVGIIPYGMDLKKDGAIGPRTIGRLRAALRASLEFPTAECVVSASMDPTHSVQQVSMGQLMAEWLIAHGVPSDTVRVGMATTFNTEGEQDVGISCRYGHEIHVSSWWHLPRIALMRWRRGITPETKVSYRACWDIPPLKGGLLEIGKLFVCLLPQARQQALAKTVKKLMRTSY